MIIRAATALIERDDGKILCVFNKRYNGFSLPGGKVEKGETPEQAVIREVMEETGTEVLSLKPIFDGPHNLKIESTRGSHVHVFEAIIKGEPKECEFGCSITWLTKKEFLECSPMASFYKSMFSFLESQEAYTDQEALSDLMRRSTKEGPQIIRNSKGENCGIVWVPPVYDDEDENFSCPCSGNCCKNPNTYTPEHICYEDICEDCYVTECENCKKTCCCDL